MPAQNQDTTSNETQQPVVTETSKTTTVKEATKTTPAKPTPPKRPGTPGKTPTASTTSSTTPGSSRPGGTSPRTRSSEAEELSRRSEELRGLIRQFEGYPALKEQVAHLEAVLTSVEADVDNRFLTTLHANKLATVEAALESMSSEIAKIPTLERNQNLLGTKHNRLVGRVNVHDRMLKPFKFPLVWALIAAVALGFLVGAVWNWIDFKSPVVGLPNTEPQFYSDFRNDFYNAVYLGIITFFVVMAAFLFVALMKYSRAVRMDQPQEVTEQDPDHVVLETSQPAIPRNPNPVTAEQSVGGAPTKPLPAAQGVPVDAR